MTEITEVPETLSCRDRGYAALVGPAWHQLPKAVRNRFGLPIARGETRIYQGTVLITELSFLGRVLASLARVVGGPVPLKDGATGPTMVGVTEVDEFGGDGIRAQIWTRSYARTGAFPQVVQSAKCFTGPTGLEERLGYGQVLRLATYIDRGPFGPELVFACTAYLLRFAGVTLTLPAWLSPGRCEVRHRDEGGGTFTFTLTITHPLFGRLVRQVARYEDTPVKE